MNVALPICADSGIGQLAETSHCPVVQILVLTSWQKTVTLPSCPDSGTDKLAENCLMLTY